MLWKSRPCAKLTGMIDADHVPIGHVSGSHQLGYFSHEMIIFFFCAHSRPRGARQRVDVMMCVESRELSLFESLHLSILRPPCIGDRTWSRMWGAGRVGMWMCTYLLPQPRTL